jgi:hypothetical protein
MMRRVITEWGIAISIVLFIAVLLAWADSCLSRWGREAFAVGAGVYIKTLPGFFCLASELGEDWKPVSHETGRRFWMATHRYRAWLFPGIEYHNRQYTSGLTVWSLEIALWVPLSFLAVFMAICWRLRPRLPVQLLVPTSNPKIQAASTCPNSNTSV